MQDLQNDDEPNSGWKMKDKIISMNLYIFQPAIWSVVFHVLYFPACDLTVIFHVLYFPACDLTVIFHVLYFPACDFGLSIFMSCIFQPCDLVRHFPCPIFSSMWFDRNFPCPIFSSMWFWFVHFHVLYFPALWFGLSFSTSYIFQHVIWFVLYFSALRFGPSLSMSYIFQPCDLVCHFLGLAFSSPVIFFHAFFNPVISLPKIPWLNHGFLGMVILPYGWTMVKQPWL